MSFGALSSPGCRCSRRRARALSPLLGLVGSLLFGSLGCSAPAASERDVTLTALITPRAATPPSRSASPVASRGRPSAPSAAPDRCSSLANEIASAEREAAAQPSACARDEDCECYGGPVCANALVTSCPGAVTRAAADSLAGLLRAGEAEKCGGYLWSPNRCIPRCTSGRCVTHEW